MRGRTIVLLFVAGLVIVGTAVASANGRWSTHLTGDQEVPAVETQAQGQAIFKLSDDGSTLHYKLIASNIENITQAHIHLRANAGAPTGGIVVWLYPNAPPAQLIPGRHDGVLAEGSITEDDFVNALDGASMETLVAALESGLAYANVHTSANPPGEIRGDIR
jgi:CHRD domain-containing protein